MPELPEVETVRRGLAAHMEGKRITQLSVRNGNLRQKVQKDLAKALTGLTLTSTERRAKYLLLHFTKSITLIVHLGMSGSMVIYPEPPKHYQKHDHVIFTLSDGSVVIYRDPRRFGLMLYGKTKEITSHPLLAHLGPEPLSPAWKAPLLYAIFQSRKTAVKLVIMDQEVVVGVGNIYACEALFQAKILPSRPAQKVTAEETTALVKAIKAVLRDAITSGGSTLRDYVRSSGDSGYFQHHFNVYGRQKKPCHLCNTPIAVMRQSGRSSFYCPHCQR